MISVMQMTISRLSALLFLVTLAMGGDLQAKAPPPGTNASNGAADIYFAIDTSGSMSSSPNGFNLYARGMAQGCSSSYYTYSYSGISSTSSYYYYRYYRYGRWYTSYYYLPYYNSQDRRYYQYRSYSYNQNGSYYYNSNMGFVTRALRDIVTEPDLAANAHFGLNTWSSYDINRFYPSSTGGATINRMVEQCDAAFRPSGGTSPDHPLEEAYRYFARQGSTVNTCGGRQRAVILLSDGQWSSYTQSRAISWANSLRAIGVSTFVVGFTTLTSNSAAGRNYIDLAAAGGTTPILSSNIQTITNEIKNYIRSIVQANLSFTSPVILPSISGSDRVYQPDFVFSQQGQWRGSLRGYELLPNGFINQTRGELFDAGELLNSVRAADRRIWTVMPGLGYSASGGVGNLTATHLAHIHAQTSASTGFSQSLYTSQMIDFIRGVDVFNDNDLPNNAHNERWKLGDIYNSTPTLVGPPTADVRNTAVSSVRDVSSASEYRSLTNYRSFQSGTSCGTRCSSRPNVIYAGSNGGLLHAFDENGRELWAFMPYAFRHQWGTNNPERRLQRRSTAVYGVDGQIVAQDVFVGGQWRTYLAFGMGRGGRAFYVLDVTDPNAPTLVYGVENNLANGEVLVLTGNGNVRRWYSNQPASDISDYEFLGFTTSTPRIELKNVAGLPRWVLSIPAGYDSSSATQVGKALFELDLDTLQLINGGAVFVSDDGGDGIANAVIADADLVDKSLFIPAGSRVDYATILPEREGVLSIVDGGTYGRLVDLEASSALDRQLFFSPTTAYDRRGVMNIFGATGDYFNIQNRDSRNANVVFGVDLDTQLLGNAGIGANGNQMLLPAVVSQLSGMWSANSNSSCPLSEDWRYQLNTYEKASGGVAITSSSVFVPAYTPAANCIGTSRLLELDLNCGILLNSYSLGEGMVTTPVVYRNRIYAGISSRTTPQGGGQYQNAVREGNLIVIEPAQAISPDGELTFESWTEY